MRPSYTLSVPTPTRCKICLPEKRGLQVHLQSLKPYVYRPLQTPSSIRALKLILEPDERHVRGTLMEIDLESKDNSYAALSYTWGAQGTPHSIECDGQQIAVTCNLYSAVHRLRELRLDVAIFVDALCINQGQELKALRERERQVMMMGRIYSQAVRVIVDLGDASDESIRATEFLEKIKSFDAADWGKHSSGCLRWGFQLEHTHWRYSLGACDGPSRATLVHSSMCNSRVRAGETTICSAWNELFDGGRTHSWHRTLLGTRYQDGLCAGSL
jgi:hypothetical protein